MKRERGFISVIVPVYNTELYLHKCVLSLINQTFKDYEIIIIDDGSRKVCADFCDQLEQENEKISTYHKTNGGLSSARNLGIVKAVGEYICFVDSDDYVSQDYLEILYNSIITAGATVSCCNYAEIDANGRIRVKKAKSIICSGEDAIEFACYQQNFDTHMTMKLFKYGLFETLRFKDGIWYEDTDLFYQIFHKSEKVSFIEKPCYFYVSRQTGIMNTKFNEKTLELLEVANDMKEFICIYHPTIKKAARYRYIYSNLYIMHKILRTESYRESCKVCISVREMVRSNTKGVYFNRKVKLMKKLEIFLFNTNFRLYVVIYRLFYTIKESRR